MKTISRGASALMLALAICNSCSSYQTVPLEDIRAKPEKVVGKKARVHFAVSMADTVPSGAGRSVHSHRVTPANAVMYRDSTVWMRFDELHYPFANGPTVGDATMFGDPPAPDTVLVNLMVSERVEINDFHAGWTALALFGIWSVVAFVAGVSGARWAWSD